MTVSGPPDDYTTQLKEAGYQLFSRPQHWGVDVRVDGENVLTIESNCLSGVENIHDYADAIRTCAHHLLAFIGDPAPAKNPDQQSDSGAN